MCDLVKKSKEEEHKTSVPNLINWLRVKKGVWPCNTSQGQLKARSFSGWCFAEKSWSWPISLHHGRT